MIDFRRSHKEGGKVMYRNGEMGDPREGKGSRKTENDRERKGEDDDDDGEEDMDG